MEKLNRTAIVILTWNKLPVLKNTIDSFKKYNNVDDHDIIIVDNGSTDGTPDFLKKTNYDIILNERNFGAQMGKYIGWNRAENRGYDFILFIECDHPCYKTVPISDLERYLDKNKNVGIVRLNNKRYLKRHQITHLPIQYYRKEKLNSKFKIFKCNYHFTSHPSIFRTSLIYKIRGCVLPEYKPKMNKSGIPSLGFEKYKKIDMDKYKTAVQRSLMNFGIKEKEYMRLYMWAYILTAQIRPTCFKYVKDKRSKDWRN